MRSKASNYTETVASVAKGTGTPSAATIRTYCDLGLIPFIRDANGRRLLPSDAGETICRVYAERTANRGRPGRKASAA